VKSGYRSSGFWKAWDAAAQKLDDKVGWHKLPKLPGLAVLVGVRNILRRENLFDTRTLPSVNEPPVPPYEARFKTQRTADGSYNDLSDPAMGMAGSRFGRNVPLDRAMPEREPEIMTPNPRLVSTALLTRTEFVPATSVNAIAAAWLQFMIRDWFNHGRGTTENAWRIELAPDDSFPERTLEIPRIPADPTRPPGSDDGPATFVNTETHWWDGSSIYGANSEQQQIVRSFEGGKLKLTPDGRLPVIRYGERDPSQEPGFWLGLVMLHELFAREHNAICDRLAAEYGQWDDEQLFQRARLINAALLAKIHTMEWTPAVISHPTTVAALRANWFGLAEERVHKLFGRISDDEVISGIPGAETAHYDVPYSLTEEFTAVYRMHPLIPDHWSFRAHADDRPLAEKTFRELTGPAALDMGSAFAAADLFYSFGTEHPGVVTLHNFPHFLQEFERPDGRFMDLAAIDILRVREQGVRRYCEFRRLLHLPVPKTFDELTDNPAWARELASVYADVEQVDLVVGMYAEPRPAGFAFSDTAFRIFILMASRRLNSDRFLTEDYTPDVYTEAGMKWIDDTQMTQVLLRHMPELRPALRGLDNAFAPWVRSGPPA
jgi:hypothetical protein